MANWMNIIKDLIKVQHQKAVKLLVSHSLHSRVRREGECDGKLKVERDRLVDIYTWVDR